MPKFGIHTITMSETIAALGHGNQIERGTAVDLVNNNDMAMLGAIGPDLFFWAPDYEIADILIKFHKNIQKLNELYNSVMEPVNRITNEVSGYAVDAVSFLADDTVDLIRDLIDEIMKTSELFQSAMTTGLLSGGIIAAETFDTIIEGIDITNSIDVPLKTYNFFQNFKPLLQDNDPISDWYWFDMLHYRNTGDFARNLISNAGTPMQRAYAYGYLSHIATDVVGHPFVNQIAGGPYRLNIQRHVTVENYMDCDVFAKKFERARINKKLLSTLNLPGVLPDEIANLLRTAFEQTYSNVPHPQRLSGTGFLSKGEIKDTFAIFKKVLEILRDSVVDRPEPPFEDVLDILADALGDVWESPPSPPETDSETCSLQEIFSFGLTESSKDCYDEFFEEAEKYIKYTADLFKWAFDRIKELLDLLLTALLSLPITVLLAILYGLQLMLYEVYKAGHAYLATLGFVTPDPDEIENSIGLNLTTMIHQCSHMGKFNEMIYPKRRKPDKSHLVCPKGPLEYPLNIADFNYQSESITADTFIRQKPMILDAVKKYAESSTPAVTRATQSKLKIMGNAVDLTRWMIGKVADPNTPDEEKELIYTNWNLDADRGYGYKCWKGKIPDDDPFEIENEEYI